jgi:biotin transport system substrate-specific component
MQTTTATTIPTVVIERIIRGRASMNMLLIVGASLLIALAAQIAVPLPLNPVPMTLQPLAVLMVGAALGSRRGAAVAVLYLLEGFSGLPVFAQGHGGAVWALAATAGYLWSYPAAAFVAGWFSERGWGSTLLRSLTGMLVALGVVYLGGWSWLATLTGPAVAFTTGVAPFVLADVIKVIIGAAFLPAAQKLISKLA